MSTIIDSLVVTLGLDPAKFGASAKAAIGQTDEITKAIKRLGVEEDKLSDKQKAALDDFRKSFAAGVAQRKAEKQAAEDKKKEAARAREVEATEAKARKKKREDTTAQAKEIARVKKETDAAAKSSEQLFGVLKTGALGFAAAIGLTGLAELTKDAIGSNAALYRFSRVLGIGAKEAAALGNAVELAGGKSDEALGTIQGLNNIMVGMKYGAGLPPEFVRALAVTQAETGIDIPIANQDGSPRTAKQFVDSLPAAIRALGPEKASVIWGSVLDQGTLALLGKPDDERQKLIAQGEKNTQDQGGYGDAEKARQSVTALRQAVKGLVDELILLTATPVVSILDGFTKTFHWFRHPIDTTKANLHGRSFLQKFVDDGLEDAAEERERDRERADESAQDAQRGVGATSPPDSGAPDAPSGAPDSGAPDAPSGAPSTRGLRNNNRGNLMYAGQPGATPDPFVAPDGTHYVMAKFGTMAEGDAALANQFKLDMTDDGVPWHGAHTLREIARSWVRGRSDNPEVWARQMSDATGIGLDQTLYPDQQTLDRLTQAVAYPEGNSGAGGASGGASGGGGDTFHVHGPTHVSIQGGSGIEDSHTAFMDAWAAAGQAAAGPR